MIAYVRRLWVALLGAALIVVCLMAGAAIRSVAQTPPPQHLQIALPANGEGFSVAPRGSVLNTVQLAPGRAAYGVMGVRNTSDGPAQLSLAMIDIRNDARCSSGSACRDGRRQMAHLLRFTIATATSRHGPYRSVWTGTAPYLARSVRMPGALATDGVSWVRLTARLPHRAGNDVQRQGLRFGLRVALDAGVLGTSTTVLGGHQRHGVRIAGLAVTGTQVAMLTALSGALLLVGLVVTALGRRRPDTGLGSICPD